MGDRIRVVARLPIAIALSSASGVLYGLTFPTTSLQPLAWVALVPFFVVLRRVGRGTAVLVTWIWTITAAYTLGDWFAGSIARYYHQPLTIGIGFFFGVSSLMAAPYYVLVAVAYRAFAGTSRTIDPFLAAAAWWRASWHAAGSSGGIHGHSSGTRRSAATRSCRSQTWPASMASPSRSWR